MKRNRTPLQENPLTEYEKKRQEQILKNQEFLISLGLTSPSVAIPSLLPSRQAKRRRFSSSSSSSSSSSLDSSSANDCEDLQKGDEKGEKEKEELLSVWSSRLRSRRTRDETHSIEKTEKSTPSQKQKNKTKERPKITTDAGEKMSLERSNQKSDFSRNLFCDLGRLKQNLGIPFSSFGKQAAMNISSQCGTSPRFNKYSGVTEWKNAIFLWVNFPESPEEANYDNAIWRAQKVEDSEATSKWSYFISWFSGKTMTLENPMVQKLIHSNLSEGQQIYLFCRIPGQPYINCGQLNKVTHVSFSKSPFVRIVWELVDSEILHEEEDFQNLLAQQQQQQQQQKPPEPEVIQN